MSRKKQLLLTMLDEQREGIVATLDGLTETQVNERLVPSVTTLLSMIKHLGFVERWWFQEQLCGASMSYPWTDEDPDAEFRVEVGESAADIIAFYQGEILIANTNIDARSLSAPLAAKHGHSPKDADLFWLLLHMIQETAQHRGQADILREQLLAAG